MFQKIEMVKYKNIAEGFFNALCSIYEYVEVQKGCITEKVLAPVSENIPCRRGYSTGGNINYAKTGEENKDNVEVKQLVKLFMPHDTLIKPGSFVKIMYGGYNEYYEYSGYSLLYDTHIEVLLRSAERWA